MELGETTVVIGEMAALIILAELGDKSFFVAVLLGLEYNPFVVFVGCIAALATSTVLAAFIGHLLSAWVPKYILEFAAAILFAGFAVSLFVEWLRTPADAQLEGLEEAEDDVGAATGRKISLASSERENQVSGSRPGSRPGSRVSTPGEPSKQQEAAAADGGANAPPHDEKLDVEATPAKTCCHVFLMAFSLTFLGELGDKTQFAVLAEAASHPPVLVGIGAMIGFIIITLIAVLFGRQLASMLSQRLILLLGVACFSVFSVICLIHGLQDWHKENNRENVTFTRIASETHNIAAVFLQGVGSHILRAIEAVAQPGDPTQGLEMTTTIWPTAHAPVARRVALRHASGRLTIGTPQ